MEIFLIKLLQFLLSISLLVLLHEGGHFFFSKLFGVRVEKFYLFFDPWFHIFEWKPRNSDTKYGIGWLPLGGYCKIAGMIDESFDTKQMASEPQPWEFRSKPAWQRLLIMIGGVLVNFLLALFIYSMIMFTWGESYYKVSDMTMGMKFNSAAKELGFQDHDILLGTDKGTFRDFTPDLYRGLADGTRADIIRDGKRMSIPLPGNLNLLDMIKSEPAFVRPFIPAKIEDVMKDSPAAKAGIAKGDVILALAGRQVDSWNEYNDVSGRLQDMLATATTTADSMKVRNTQVVVKRKNSIDTIAITLTPDLKMGVYQASLGSFYKITTDRYGFLESFPAGIRYGISVLKGYVGDMRYMFSADGAKSLGGFGAIGNMFPAEWDWYLFWKMTAFLSIILAFMNILPIPALDGGHVLFLLYEIITRRKPGEKFLVVAEYIGISLLLLLMVVANLNDILRALGIM
ncbi:MAG: RIP metalloprotease RseP [Prevotella sp.]|nr:RIP metalloprotease RseP [Prevotella sp.]MDD6394090.1 RIP metalloprotease RseP [Prevotella sp.]MDY2702994.1 RIP metalloprotease RseP [Prevotella sp.]